MRLPSSEAEDVAPGASLLWLLGQPSLEEYVSFVATRVIGGIDIAPLSLADEWRAANDRYHELEQAEAGECERIRSHPLPAELEELANDVRANHSFAKTFDTVPTTIEMVELDRLILWQGQLSDDYAMSGAAGRALANDPTALFDYCLPLHREVPPFTLRRLGADRFQLISEATDFSAQDPQLLGSAERASLTTTGLVAAALAIPISFGANFMSAIRSDNRILLHNGYHRAYALRANGIKMAPCIVQTVTRRDELKAVADTRVASDPGFYFRAARPPMLRDFFDPQLIKRLCVYPIETVVDIHISRTHWSATKLPARAAG